MCHRYIYIVTRRESIMKPPCETVVHDILPALRAGVVRILYDDYKMKQTEIASALGITQASVSQYLAGVRAKEKHIPLLKKRAQIIAEKVFRERPPQAEVILTMCAVCSTMSEQMSCCRTKPKRK